jgi:hypothetical protein
MVNKPLRSQATISLGSDPSVLASPLREVFSSRSFRFTRTLILPNFRSCRCPFLTQSAQVNPLNLSELPLPDDARQRILFDCRLALFAGLLRFSE